MPDRYRVAIIGSTRRGDYGHGIDTVWKEIPLADVVGVADEDDAGRAAAIKRTGAPKGYADYRQMLDEEKPHIVAICPRWVDRHHEFILACAERGCHIYMEKPFCRTLEEADEIVKRCEMSHVKLAIAHQTRYSPTTLIAKRMIADGKIGRVLELRGRGKEDKRGGSEDLFVLGSHIMNLMQFLAGDPLSCTATMTQDDNLVAKKDVREGTEGLGLFAGNGLNATYRFKDGVNGYFASYQGQGGNPSRFGLQVYGSKGVLEVMPGFLNPVYFLADPGWSPARAKSQWTAVSTGGAGVPEPMKPSNLHGGNVAAVTDLIAAIEADRRPLCDIYEARWTIEMIMGVYESQRVGKGVSLPLENRKHPLSMLT